MKSFQKPISFLFLLYFLILFAERFQSLYRSFSLSRKEMFSSSFDIYVTLSQKKDYRIGLLGLIFQDNPTISSHKQALL